MVEFHFSVSPSLCSTRVWLGSRPSAARGRGRLWPTIPGCAGSDRDLPGPTRRPATLPTPACVRVPATRSRSAMVIALHVRERAVPRRMSSDGDVDVEVASTSVAGWRPARRAGRGPVRPPPSRAARRRRRRLAVASPRRSAWQAGGPATRRGTSAGPAGTRRRRWCRGRAPRRSPIASLGGGLLPDRHPGYRGSRSRPGRAPRCRGTRARSRSSRSPVPACRSRALHGRRGRRPRHA